MYETPPLNSGRIFLGYKKRSGQDEAVIGPVLPRLSRRQITIMFGPTEQGDVLPPAGDNGEMHGTYPIRLDVEDTSKKPVVAPNGPVNFDHISGPRRSVFDRAQRCAKISHPSPRNVLAAHFNIIDDQLDMFGELLLGDDVSQAIDESCFQPELAMQDLKCDQPSKRDELARGYGRIWLLIESWLWFALPTSSHVIHLESLFHEANSVQKSGAMPVPRDAKDPDERAGSQSERHAVRGAMPFTCRRRPRNAPINRSAL